MMLILLALASLFDVTRAEAQDLMAQCAKIDEQAKRLECFDAVARGSRSSPSAEQKFAAVSRAAHTLMGAVDAGLTYAQLGDRILAFSSELSIASGQAESENEKAAFDKYNAALVCYNDTRTLWDSDIRFNRGMIRTPLPVAFVPDIVVRHKLPTVSADLLGFVKGIDAPTAIRSLWIEAAGNIRDADELLKGRAANPSAKQVTGSGESAPGFNIDGNLIYPTAPITIFDAPSKTANVLLVQWPGVALEEITHISKWTKVETPDGAIGWIEK